MNLDTPGLAPFVQRQLRDFGGNVEVDTGLFALFGVEAGDAEGNTLAQTLLRDVPFAHEVGSAEDDQWTLYYVDTANRPTAIHWLDDYQRRLYGEYRLPSPAQRRAIDELAESAMPHRVAQKLGEDHDALRLCAGSVRAPKLVRALLDRLHLREPLFYSAFQQLLTHHLIDMMILLQQLIPEDVALTNDSMKGSVSRDPFVQSRQAAAADIRSIMIRFCVINTLDQQKTTAITNPYAAYMEIMRKGEEIILPIDGKTFTTTTENFVTAIRAIRCNVFLGGKFEEFDTQVPWMRDEIAHPFRFIKQRLEAHRDLQPLDGMYMLERAVEM